MELLWVIGGVLLVVGTILYCGWNDMDGEDSCGVICIAVIAAIFLPICLVLATVCGIVAGIYWMAKSLRQHLHNR
jgi:hypothetical protein